MLTCLCYSASILRVMIARLQIMISHALGFILDAYVSIGRLLDAYVNIGRCLNIIR